MVQKPKKYPGDDVIVQPLLKYLPRTGLVMLTKIKKNNMITRERLNITSQQINLTTVLLLGI